MTKFNLKNGGENNCFAVGLVAFPEPPFSYTPIKRHDKKIIFTSHR